MGQLINGKWEATDEVQAHPSVHAHELGTTEFPFDESTSGRYHLFVAKSCPFAQRAEIALHLKGLAPKIGVSIAHPVQTAQGWGFEADGLAGVGNNASDAKYLHEVYSKADPNFTGRVTVPLLYDTHANRIVSKESADIVAIFAEVGTAGPDLTAHATAQQQAVPLFGEFFGGLLKVGRAEDQKSYDAAIAAFYAVVEKIEAHLAKSKFLAGDEATAVDVNTFPAFAGFEIGLGLKMLITGNRLRDYPNLDAYIRRFYQLPGVRDAVDPKQWKLSIFAEANKNKFFSPKKEHIAIATPDLDWNKPVN